MILDVFVMAFVLSLILRRMDSIFKRNYRHVYIVPVAFAIQFVPFHKEIFIPVSFAMLVFFVFRNAKIPGFVFMGVGMILNGLVMTLNGGKMPVLESLVDLLGLHVGDRHITVPYITWKSFLGDWIPVILPYGRKFVISVGDILVYIGVFLFFLRKSSSLNVEH